MISALLDTLQRAVDFFADVCFVVLMTIIAIGLFVLLIVVIELFIEFHRFVVSRTVVCPVTGSSAIVRLQVWRAAFSSVCSDKPDLQIATCSLCPGSQECERRCVDVLTVQ